MASCQILWESLWESCEKACGLAANKLVEKGILSLFKQNHWWKKDPNCGLIKKIHAIVVVVVEKFYQVKLPIIFIKSTIST